TMRNAANSASHASGAIGGAPAPQTSVSTGAVTTMRPDASSATSRAGASAGIPIRHPGSPNGAAPPNTSACVIVDQTAATTSARPMPATNANAVAGMRFHHGVVESQSPET